MKFSAIKSITAVFGGAAIITAAVNFNDVLDFFYLPQAQIESTHQTKELAKRSSDTLDSYKAELESARASYTPEIEAELKRIGRLNDVVAGHESLAVYQAQKAAKLAQANANSSVLDAGAQREMRLAFEHLNDVFDEYEAGGLRGSNPDYDLAPTTN